MKKPQKPSKWERSKLSGSLPTGSNPDGQRLSGLEEVEFENIVPTGKVNFSSSKCDWQIVEQRLPQQPNTVSTEFRSAISAAGISASKCDFQFKIETAAPSNALLSSSKCDFSFAIDKARIASQMSSSKCDFSLSNQIPRFANQLTSSKCDFNIVAQNASVLPVNFESTGLGSQVAVTSSKCDWKIDALGGPQQFSIRPDFSANLTSSKCDFRIEIALGLTGKQQINLVAVSSNKCDFQILPGK